MNHKRFLLILFSLCLNAIYGELAYAFPEPQTGESFVCDGFAYFITSQENKTVSITNYYYDYNVLPSRRMDVSYSGNVVIPSTASWQGQTYTVTEIGERAFYNSDITELTIPATVTLIHTNLFGDTSPNLNKIVLEDGTSTLEFGMEGGNIVTKEWYLGRNIVWQGNSLDDRNDFRHVFSFASKIVVSDVVTKLHEYQFADNQNNLKTLILGNGIKEIPAYLCTDDYNLEEVTIPNSVEKIGDGAFSRCKNFKNIIIPANVKSMYAGSYYRTSEYGNFENITFEDSETPLVLEDSYGTVLFSLTENLYLGRDIILANKNNNYIFHTTNAILGDNVTEVNIKMFGSEIEKITLGKNIKKIGDYSFYNSKIKSIDIPASTEEIGTCAFNSCDSLNTVILHEGLKTIGENAFTYCDTLKSLTIPASVDSIGEWFMYYSHMTDLTFRDSDTPLKLSMPETKIDNLYIGRNIDGGFIKAVHVSFGDKVTYIPESMFLTGTIETVTFGENVERIGKSAFRQSRITSVEIPAKVKYIEDNTFDACTQLKSLTLPEGLDSIGAGAFYDNALTELTLPASLKKIKNEAFGSFHNKNLLKRMTIVDSTEPLYVEYLSSGYQALPASVEQLYMGRDIVNYGNSSYYETKFWDVIDLVFGENVTTLKGKPNGSGIFSNSNNIKNVTAPWNNPISIDDKSFSTTVYNNATLHVPHATTSAYKAAIGWKNFFNIEEMEETKCATPTIALVNDKIVFSCETKNVEFVSEVKCPDTGEYSVSSIPLTKSYIVTVYAKKEGLEDSDVATKEINIGGGSGASDKKGDVNGDGEVGMPDVMFIVNYILNGEFPAE